MSVELMIQEAAQVIGDADLLIITAGAGMSADSGLKVYADVADIEAYRTKKMDYADLCDPDLLQSDYRLFMGFWGQCFNDYRETTPHAGYRVLRRWLDSKGADHPTFTVTANVDHHFLVSGLARQHECQEIHGTTETWQCSNRDCEVDELIVAPPGYRFNIDPVTMLACPVEEVFPQVSGFIPSECAEWYATESISHRSFAGEYPTCVHCSARLRPAVLMFGDFNWLETKQQRRNYRHWRETLVPQFIRQPAREGRPVTVAVVEIGAGERVPSIRHLSEKLVEELRSEFRVSIKRSVLVRINPSELDTSSSLDSVLIPLKGLDAITAIDALIPDDEEADIMSQWDNTTSIM